MNILYVIKYSGPFGFIKPWTAVRDGETYSQQFLTPSIIEGMEKKLFPELLESKGIQKICSHRLNYEGLSIQQEKTWSKGGFRVEKSKNQWKTNVGILSRGVMIEPNLYLAFLREADAKRAYSQTLCLCRNEDLIFPEEMIRLNKDAYDNISGFELDFTQKNFKVGHNRFEDQKAMFGNLKIIGNPIRSE